MEYLIAIILALLGGLFYQKTKRESAEALNENQETKEKLLDVDKSNLEDKARLEVEKEKAEHLKEEHEKINVNDETIKQILDYFDKFKPNK